MAERKIIVLDNGTGSIKCGYPGTNFPEAVFPTIVGRPVLRAGAITEHLTAAAAGTSAAEKDGPAHPELKDVMLGDETLGVRHLLKLSQPMAHGVVKKEGDMCLLWDYAFSQKLKADPTEHWLSLSEAPGMGNPQRARTFELLFENFGVPGIQSTMQGILALYSAGLTTGIALDCGEGVTHCTPIFDGYEVRKANLRSDIGGRNVTEYLVRLMQRRGYSFNSSADFETAKAMKEMLCYAAQDFDRERRLARETTVLEKTMKLPDGKVCAIGSERFEAVECLFNPAHLGEEADGLSHLLWNSIEKTDMDVRRQLYENVVLSGGSTMFPGLPSRLEADMKALFVEKKGRGNVAHLSRFPLKINDAPRRKNMVFLGAACYAELCADNDDMWLSKATYEEEGSRAVDRIFGAQYM